jgi:hypothetical protein
MSTERPVLWQPGPGARPDGLRDAFRRAHRRRVRTAATASLPVVLSVVTLAALPVTGGTSSLDLSPAGRPNQTGAPGEVADAIEAIEAIRPGAAVAGGRAAAAGDRTTAHGSTSAGAPNGSRGNDAPPSPLPVPTSVPTRPANTGYLDLSSTGSASTHIELTDDAFVQAYDTEVTTAGRYAGLYLVSDDGTTRGGLYRMLDTGFSTLDITAGMTELSGAFQDGDLPAGGYTVYVLGEGSVRVRVPIWSDGAGITATASTPATVHFGHTSRTFQAGEVEATVRLPITGDTTSVGTAGAIFGGNKTNSGITICLSARDTACAGDDPQGDSGATVSLAGGTEGGGVEVEEGTLAVDRDVLAKASASAQTDGRVYAWYLVLDL